MINQLSDHELIARYLKGDERSFELLVKRYTNAMYAFIMGYVHDDHVAQDITQEVFLKVFKNAKKIDATKNFKSWIYTIAKHTTFDVLKKKKSIPFSQFEKEDGGNYLTEVLKDGAVLPDQASAILEQKKKFLQGIGRLSNKYKTILSLYYYGGFNFREIAEKLEASINTVKSRHRRGVMLLKKIMLMN